MNVCVCDRVSEFMILSEYVGDYKLASEDVRDTRQRHSLFLLL